jgi:hypothetical protein
MCVRFEKLEYLFRYLVNTLSVVLSTGKFEIVEKTYDIQKCERFQGKSGIYCRIIRVNQRRTGWITA